MWHLLLTHTRIDALQVYGFYTKLNIQPMYIVVFTEMVIIIKSLPVLLYLLGPGTLLRILFQKDYVEAIEDLNPNKLSKNVFDWDPIVV